MDDFLVGLLVILIGAGVCFLGLRLWFFMLPIWGFVAGIFVGAGAVTAIFGDDFLSTVTGWAFGVVVGLVFAVLSYLVWYAGAIIAAASVGALLGSGLMAAFNVDADWIVFLAAAVGALVVGLLAFVLAVPVWVVVLGTASAGATATIAGLLLVLDRIDLDQLERGAASAMIDDSLFWILVWAGFATLGIVAQVRWVSEIELPDDRWTRGQFGPPPAAAPA